MKLRDAASWLHDDVFEVLRRHGAALCVHDLIDDHPFVTTTDWTYVRFHGLHATTSPYWGRYGERGLATRAAQLAEVLERGDDVYAYFNNDHEGHAVADAQTLRRAIDPGSRWG
jgi:uncharacterized protein YecE (DUF72 family)